MENSQIVIEGIDKETLEADALLNVLTSIRDFLSDAYFLKHSFNRYCKNKGVTSSEIEKDLQVKTVITQINNVVSKVKSGAVSIDGSLAHLLEKNKISKQRYPIMKGLISDILELVDKHDLLKWHDTY